MKITTRSSGSLLALVVLVATALTLLPSPTGGARAAASTTVSVQAGSDFVELINAERTQRGLRPLCVAADLTDDARDHSATMRSVTRLHHNPDLGSDVANWRRVTENVGVGYSITSLHAAFMGSSGHRANILDERVSQIGVAVVTEPDGRRWVTQVFRRPADAAVTPCVTEGLAAAGVGAKPLVGDWDGDGVETPGWWEGGNFTLSNARSGAGPLIRFRYGTGDDQPLVGDWDGDGRDTIGIVRDREWHLNNRLSGGTSDIVFTYGRTTQGDIPLVGDWNGDGIDTPAIVRDGDWHFRNRLAGGNSDFWFRFGRVTQGDIPFVGDWNGDGIDTAGIIRDGDWHLVDRHRGGAADLTFNYGRVSRGDVPVVGDWDGDGGTDIAVVRGATWYLRGRLAGGPADWAHAWLP